MTAVLLRTELAITPIPEIVQSLFSVGRMVTSYGRWFDPVRLASSGMLMPSPAGRPFSLCVQLVS